MDNLADAAGLSISGGGTLTLNGTWANSGSLSATNSAVVLDGTWANLDSVTTTGSTVTLRGIWSNIGQLSATNTTLNLGGSVTLAQIGTLVRSGGTVNVTGNLTNTGTTVVLNATTGSWVIGGGGMIKGGTVTTSGGARLIGGGGTLDGVTVNGEVEVIGYQSLEVKNGLVLNGTLTVGHATDGSWGRVNFAGTQTLGGNAIVIFGNDPYQNNFLRPSDSTETLTLGAGVAVRGRTGAIGGGSTNGSVVNQGNILADVSGGSISISGQSVTNSGNLSASAGATLILSGSATFDGTKTLSS